LAALPKVNDVPQYHDSQHGIWATAGFLKKQSDEQSSPASGLCFEPARRQPGRRLNKTPEPVFLAAITFHPQPSYQNMSGVTRRRVAGGGTSSTTEGNGATSVDISYAPSAPNEEKKIAYDPKDLEDDKDKKEPKLTLMEEVLLLGLKDRQVSDTLVSD
jgi:hypothetical protein